jgi:uncharacterized membrane protein
MTEKIMHPAGGGARNSHAEDQRIEMFLGQLLRVGVLVAAVVVLLGAGLYLRGAARTAPDAASNYRVFHGQPAELTSVSTIWQGARELEPLAVIQFGLLLLIATPVARVVFSIVGFAMERDWLYIAVTIVVLALLIYSLTSGTHL